MPYLAHVLIFETLCTAVSSCEGASFFKVTNNFVKVKIKASF